MTMLYINKEIADTFEGQDPYNFLEDVECEIYRDVKARKTFRFKLNAKGYFAKLHSGVGWLEIFKNLFTFRFPIVGARNEWEAIHRVKNLNIATMNIVAYGEWGWNPARKKSFIITEELINTISLEDYCKKWKNSPPNPAQKRNLIKEVAKIAGRLHRNGICHRDFYLCHLLLHTEEISFPKISVIDLHRAIIRKDLAARWVIKDLAGLYYSAKNIGLTQGDLLRFVRHYDGGVLRSSLIKKDSFWRQVNFRANKMYKKLGPSV